MRRSAIALRTPADAFVANLATKCAAAAARSPDPVPTAALRNACYAPARRTLARRRAGAGRRGRFGLSAPSPRSLTRSPIRSMSGSQSPVLIAAHHHAEALANEPIQLASAR